jgi:hypothetical protein
MTGLDRPARVPLVWYSDMALTGETLNATREGIRFKETQERLGELQSVLLQVAQYTDPVDQVENMCDHPGQIIM